MENECSEGTEEQYFKYPSEESLVRDVHVRHSNSIRKYAQHLDPGYGVTIECKSENVASLVGIIHYGNYDSRSLQTKNPHFWI